MKQKTIIKSRISNLKNDLNVVDKPYQNTITATARSDYLKSMQNISLSEIQIRNRQIDTLRTSYKVKNLEKPRMFSYTFSARHLNIRCQFKFCEKASFANDKHIKVLIHLHCGTDLRKISYNDPLKVVTVIEKTVEIAKHMK